MNDNGIYRCRLCGKNFRKPVGWKLGFCCSTACVSAAARRRRNPHYYQPRLCDCCGVEFMPSPKHAYKQRACSISCGKKLWYQTNKRRIDAYRAQWSVDNPAKQRGYHKISVSKRPEYYQELRRLAESRRRARVNNCASNRYSPQEWQELKAKYGNRCLCCGRTESAIELTADHVVPLCVGGIDSIDNIQPLCRSCNTWKHIRTIDFREAA